MKGAGLPHTMRRRGKGIYMIANTKYKINSISKDLGLKANDLVNILKAHPGEGAVHTSSIDEDDFAIIFETLTLENQISGLEDYLAGRVDVAPEHRPKPVERKEEKKEPEKKPEPDKTPVKPAETKPDTKTDVKKQPDKTPDKQDGKRPAQPEQKQSRVDQFRRQQQQQKEKQEKRPTERERQSKIITVTGSGSGSAYGNEFGGEQSAGVPPVSGTWSEEVVTATNAPGKNVSSGTELDIDDLDLSDRVENRDWDEWGYSYERDTLDRSASIRVEIVDTAFPAPAAGGGSGTINNTNSFRRKEF